MDRREFLAAAAGAVAAAAIPGVAAAAAPPPAAVMAPIGLAWQQAEIRSFMYYDERTGEAVYETWQRVRGDDGAFGPWEVMVHQPISGSVSSAQEIEPCPNRE